jgi:hypothetical protein
MKKFSELRGTLKEGKLGKLPDPPPMITMRRTAIRVYPKGLKIALYRNDKLNLDVSVPYHSGEFENQKLPYAKIGMKEEILLDESIVRSLNKSAKTGKTVDVTFANGASIKIQPVVAASILKLKDMINTYNKVKLDSFISQDPNSLKTVFDFTRKEI